ncbi:hypothetical protein HK098_005298, partial [Nowakowskiella sp. JEL0407]
DVYAERTSAQGDTRLSFDQSLKVHSAYLLWLYELFKDFVGTPPRSTNRRPDSRTGVKSLPSSIHDLLTPIGLALWLMDDGGLTN